MGEAFSSKHPYSPTELLPWPQTLALGLVLFELNWSQLDVAGLSFSKLGLFLALLSESVVSPSSSPDTGVPDSLYVVLGMVCGFCLLMLVLSGVIWVRSRSPDSWLGYAGNLSPSAQTQG